MAVSGAGLISTLRRLIPLLLSHHPHCSFFLKDTFEILGKRLCLGCAITYPTLFLTVLLLSLTHVYRWFPEPVFHQSVLLSISIVFGSVQAFKYSRREGNRGFRILVKLFLGLSLGGIVIWTLTLPTYWPFRIVLLFIALILVMFSGTSRLLYMRRICADCIYHGDWDICWGFRGINKYHSFSRINDRRRITDLIFDVEKKKGAEHGTGPLVLSTDVEPFLRDDQRWLYHDKGYDIPWLPKTGLEVTSKNELPHGSHVSRKQRYSN